MYKIAICDDNLFFIKQLRTMLKEKIRSDDQIEIYEYHSGESVINGNGSFLRCDFYGCCSAEKRRDVNCRRII